MGYTLQLSIAALMIVVTLISVLYLNGYIFPPKKDYGNEILNALYSGSEGRVKILDQTFVIKKFNLTSSSLFSYSDETEIEITALAYYNTTVKVMGKHSFEGGSVFPWDNISPYDLFFRWGDFAKSEHDEMLNEMQYYGEMRTATVIIHQNETETYQKYSSFESNNHIITMDDNVRSMIDRIKVKDIVHFEGYIAKVTSNSNGRQSVWGGKVDITDSGKDFFSCEVFYVTNVTL